MAKNSLIENNGTENKNPLGSTENKNFPDNLKEVLGDKFGKKNDQVSTSQEVPAKRAEKEKKPAYEGQQTEKLFDVKDLSSDLTPKKVLKIVGVVVMIIAIVTALYVKFFGITTQTNTATMIKIPTPTYFDYTNYKPSVYADDLNFKQIDEGISVLEIETERSPIEEQTLTPPTLDFDIVFK